MDNLEKGRELIVSYKVNPNKETLKSLQEKSLPSIHQSYSLKELLKDNR